MVLLCSACFKKNGRIASDLKEHKEKKFNEYLQIHQYSFSLSKCQIESLLAKILSRSKQVEHEKYCYKINQYEWNNGMKMSHYFSVSDTLWNFVLFLSPLILNFSQLKLGTFLICWRPPQKIEGGGGPKYLFSEIPLYFSKYQLVHKYLWGRF